MSQFKGGEGRCGDEPTPVLYPSQAEPLTPGQERIRRALASTETSRAHPVIKGAIDTSRHPVTLTPGPVAPPNSAGDGGQRVSLSPAEKVANMAECNPVTVSKVYDEPGEARDILRAIENTSAHGIAETSRGNQFSAKDRADQDRYLAGEFRGLGVAAAQVEARLQKDNVDLAHFLGNQFGDVRKELCGVGKDVLQTKFDLALAVERSGAANSLATEKVGAAVALAGEKQAAATALCCCETQAAIAASTAAVLAGIAASRQSETERLLTVFQVRAGLPGITPV